MEPENKLATALRKGRVLREEGIYPHTDIYLYLTLRYQVVSAQCRGDVKAARRIFKIRIAVFPFPCSISPPPLCCSSNPCSGFLQRGCIANAFQSPFLDAQRAYRRGSLGGLRRGAPKPLPFCPPAFGGFHRNIAPGSWFPWRGGGSTPPRYFKVRAETPGQEV